MVRMVTSDNKLSTKSIIASGDRLLYSVSYPGYLKLYNNAISMLWKWYEDAYKLS